MTLAVVIIAVAAVLIARRLGQIARALDTANRANGVDPAPGFFRRMVAQGEAARAAKNDEAT